MALEAQDALDLDPIIDDQDSNIQETPVQNSLFSNNTTSSSNEPRTDNNLIDSLLADNGITDSSRIKFEDENGRIVERDWNDLTKEEQFNILRTRSMGDAAKLDPDEIDFINYLRQNYDSPEDYVRSLRNQASEIIDQDQGYEIDDLDDDQLFILDAIDRYGDEDVSDEELEVLLENAKSDPELYAKTIAALRTQYKQREDDLKYRQQQVAERQQQEEFNSFGEAILNEIQSLKEVGGQEIDLSVDDMNDLANYILTRDNNGNSEFGLAMNDPKLFTQAAFWTLKGKDIMNEITTQVRRAYERGFEAGKSGRSQLAFKQPQYRDNIPQHHTGLSASELDVQ